MNNLLNILENDPYKRNIVNATKVYHGLCNCCRCGCGGRYFKKGERGFVRAINAMMKPDFEPLKKGDETQATYGKVVSEGVTYGDNYIDIPYNPDNDKCYTIYFN